MPQTPQFDAAAAREDFPIFSRPLETGRHRKGKPPAFLDSAASSQKPHCVIDRERQVQETFYANAYRGVYEFGAQIDEELESVRRRVATFIGAESKEDIVFTSGTTMSLNLVASAWGRRFLNPGDTVLITQMEHHANIVPWQRICDERQATLGWLTLTGDRRLDMDRLEELLTPRTRMVSVTAMSNVLGTVNPIDDIARRAHDVGALVCVDAAQSVPHMKTDVSGTDSHGEPVDFLAFSGHKLYGPTGVGVLYGRQELLQAMEPFLGGGHMVSQVFQSHSTWADPPARFEAGTLPIVQAIAL
ncbi:MAG: aminotransferase class V-fold PLP-dependent enzyme, partial [Planctomycetaceae bacterium]